MTRQITIDVGPNGSPTPVRIGGDAPLALIAGPCVLEGPGMALHVAQQLKAIAIRYGIGYVFKASFDKANRTSIRSARGPGLDAGLGVLAQVRSVAKVPVLTDVHETWQVGPCAEVVDILQVPAFLCRQTDLLLACAKTGKPVNVKKGQFLSPWDIPNVVQKLQSEGCEQIILTERGTSFGYQNLVVDFRSLPAMRATGYPVAFDVTHSLQLPGNVGTASGGMREYAPHLARAACAVGVDALFIETHPHPNEALSDATTMLPLDQVESLLSVAVEIHQAVRRAGVVE